MPYPSPETSTSTIPLSSTPPSAVVAITHNPYFPTSPYPASNPALDNILPTESHRSIIPPDLPPQSRSLPSVTDSGVAVGDRSLREPSAEQTGDHYPHPSHCRYDIV
ncbi:hypothetical protein EDB92DRAFT_2106470 [Lactarius akahatsu]|uniref:Uncharacterized protein n=1 Tax=Lactarius akahatsu TaxID=416441 RepID=A0AAD4L732_9AGAM|nr:hypothetical protein EDB92DRAFT_2106470 [Lactarius akahatsu]